MCSGGMSIKHIKLNEDWDGFNGKMKVEGSERRRRRIKKNQLCKTHKIGFH